LARLPRGIHFLCVPKENESKEKAPDIALNPTFNLVLWRGRKLATLTNLYGTNLDAIVAGG
jgi:hypothetical protein